MIEDAEQQAFHPESNEHELLEEEIFRLLKENRQLRQCLAHARATIISKDELILEWIAATKGWNAVAISLREESQATMNPLEHPLACDSRKRSWIYYQERHKEHARLKAQLFPPTEWQPK